MAAAAKNQIQSELGGVSHQIFKKNTLVSGDKNNVEWPTLFLSADTFNVVLIGGYLPKNRRCSYRRTFNVVLIAGHQCNLFPDLEYELRIFSRVSSSGFEKEHF